MAGISEDAISRFEAMTWPSDDEALLAQFRTGDSYWEERRQAITSLVGSKVLSTQAIIDQILEGEVLMPAARQRKEYLAAKRFAIEAIMTDPALTEAGKFQHLAKIETGKSDVGGFASHIDAIRSLLEHTPSDAPDGLILRLDFTDPERSLREFVSATPYKVNVDRLGVWVFDKRTSTEPNSRNTRTFTDDSGLHFRYSLDVLDWQRAHGLPEQQSFRVYGLYSTQEDKIAWVKHGGYGWQTSEYPSRGPAVFWGQPKIAEFIGRMMTYGGERLAKIKEDIGDYPGFEFVHDIEPTGEPGGDNYRLAAAKL